MITIIDYGSGNLSAIYNTYKKCDIECEIVDSAASLKTAKKLILPGVGAFDHTMNLLRNSGMQDVLNELVIENRVPILGICVGMQVMAKSSDEGNQAGLGWIEAEVKRFDVSKLKSKPHLPHMGWNSINFSDEGALELFKNVDSKREFYFLHSYYFDCIHAGNISATTQYGIEYASAVNLENVYGVQFHPEKSHSNGVAILKNFAEL